MSNNNTPNAEQKSQENQESQEKQFRKFATRLLKAQEYEFLKPEHVVFSPTTLRKALTKFCSVIAEEVQADSCTIQLKVYDPGGFLTPSPNPAGPPFNEHLRSRLNRVISNWNREECGRDDTDQANEDPREEQEAKVLKDTGWRYGYSSLSFPYWHYPKGVAELVATNRGGPWEKLLNPDQRGNLVPLRSGITADIFQDNFAKIRDPLSIRSSRGLRKLGGIDWIIWKNGSWIESFKNLYGTPIRIHPGGEVIGVLKVENKKDEACANFVEGCLLELTIGQARASKDGLTEFEHRILGYDEEKIRVERNHRRVSFLALAYLAADLAACGANGLCLKDFLLVPYPRESQTTHGHQHNRLQSLKESVDGAKAVRVIQVVAESIEEESRLWGMLSRADATAQDKYKSVKGFYECLSRHFAGLTYADNSLLRGALEEVPCDNGVSVTVWMRAWNTRRDDSDVILPHFHFRVQVKRDDDVVTLYVLVPPKNDEVTNLCAELFLDCANPSHSVQVVNVYNKLATGTVDPADPGTLFDDGQSRAEWNGERVSFQLPGGGAEELCRHSVVDLLVDRWAARIEALNYCVPIAEFTPEDTRKLSWAALEVGKLIEREISYRANSSHDDPIPLTAMEFYRIPISDLSFVDEMRNRRADAQKVTEHIRHHIQNRLYYMHMQNAVQLKTRVKGHRSYLSRLGERHEGFVRGNLAIWFYLLSITRPVEECLTNLPRAVEHNGPARWTAGKSQEHRDTIDFPTFLHELKAFRDFVDKAAGGLGTNNKEFFAKNFSGLIGDTRFVSPPFPPERPESLLTIKNLQDILLKNLMNEGSLRKVPRRSGSDPVQIGESEALAATELEDLIFRQYEPYAVSAGSLLCQLLNMEGREDYSSFYESCFKLRSLLATSLRDIKDLPEFNKLDKIFAEEGPWPGLTGYVETCDTKEFIKFLERCQGPTESICGQADGDRGSDIGGPSPGRQWKTLYLNPRGIYKRIRHLNHTLPLQRSPAQLEWELGRFDLLGCQLNCLYKNQVFAAYEQLWNGGDPFWGMITERPQGEFEWLPQEKFIKDRSRGRKRWLCLRTKHTEEKEGYVALQIAALVDPQAIHEGYWEKKGYNLRRVQCLLGRLFNEIDPQPAQAYKTLARVRQHLRWEYVDWYKIADELVQRKSPPSELRDGAVEAFGSFLGESAVDLLMQLVDQCLRVPASDLLVRVSTLFSDVKPSLKRFLECGAEYTSVVLRSLTKLDENARPFKITGDQDGWITTLLDATTLFYERLWQWAENNGIGIPQQQASEQQGRADERRDQWLRVVEREREYYSNLFITDGSGPSICSRVPIIYVPDGTYAEELERVNLDGKSIDVKTELRELYRILEKLRRQQKGFLFYRNGPGRLGLELRDKENMLHRIHNYVLLYDRSKNKELWPGPKKQLSDDEQKDPFLGWSSYGLFYYLRSLIPLEIQVRTMLADTLAEQYHDAVYKGAPPTGTEFPREQMEKIAGELDGIDKEMEADFEDYITKRCLLRQ